MTEDEPLLITYRDTLGRDRRFVIRLDLDSAVPRFEQLRAQLSVLVTAGRLEPGSRLPTVRDLAADLRLAPGTIARAYRELEADGTLVTRGRAGTFVSDEPPNSEPLEDRRRRIAEAAERCVDALRHLRVDDDAIRRAIDEALAPHDPDHLA